MFRWLGLWIVLLPLVAYAGSADQGGATVELDALTSPEIQQRLTDGDTTILIPLGGTEQNGPIMALGKHNVRVRLLAVKIARRLGHTLVAPVMAYVPEGSIDPPTEHMRYPGTLSIPVPVFAGLLQGTVASLAHHGFRRVILLGDHGGYQALIGRLAPRLDRQFGPRCHVYDLSAYFDAAQVEFAHQLEEKGYGVREIGTHGGLLDTSLMLALDPTLVRRDALTSPDLARYPGIHGDAARASAELGQIGVTTIVERSVAAIRALPP